MSITYKPKHPFYNFKPAACGEKGWGIFGGYDNAIPCPEQYDIVKSLVEFLNSNNDKINITTAQQGIIKQMCEDFLKVNFPYSSEYWEYYKNEESFWWKYILIRVYEVIKEKLNENNLTKRISTRKAGHFTGRDEIIYVETVLKEDNLFSMNKETAEMNKQTAEFIVDCVYLLWLNNYYAPPEGKRYGKYISGHQFKLSEKSQDTQQLFDWYDAMYKDMCKALEKWMLEEGTPFDKPPTRADQGYDWDKDNATWKEKK